MKQTNPYITYLLCAAMFVLGMIATTDNFSPMFRDQQKLMAGGHSLVLGPKTNPDSLKQLLLGAGYMTDAQDASLAAGWIVTRIKANGSIENLGQLNRPVFKIPAAKAMSEGGEEFRNRVRNDYDLLGMDSEWHKAANSSPGSDFGNGSATITVKISNGKQIPDAPLSGITVRLREHRMDSVGEKNSSKNHDKDTKLVSETLGFATTDTSGQVRFHVEPGKSYSVLPIKEGYQYGREKGTTATGQMPADGITLTFRQQEHVLTPLDSYTYQALKNDRAITVSAPADFRNDMTRAAAIYLIGWLAFFIFMIVRDRRLGTRSDYMTAGIIMMLTGIGIVSMFAMSSPLGDKSYGTAMANALGVGLVVMALVSCVNPGKFFLGKSRLQAGIIPFDPLSGIFHSKNRSRSLERSSAFSFSSGFSYLLAAVGLIMLLGMFGTGPEGSDARVNLGGFQPSELCKYLILIFVSAFFAENALLLQAFSAKLTPLSARRQLGTISVAVIVMLGLMMMYLLVLSDMGPALVVLITFIFLYSMARRDFAQLLLGLLSFIALMLIARAINNTPFMLITAAVLWFAAWLAYGWFRSRQIYESALIVNLLIVVFALGGPILGLMGAESEAARLTNRTEMSWGGQWDNHVPGGDQVAQGIWSAASGGATGMGLGNGSPSVVPAFHTDMVFTSIGEMTGFIGLLLIILCFVLLVHRSLLIGRRAGQPFTMYLVMGIALLTGVQFLFIVLGSLGIVPLTGVTVPFLSYSRTSLITTMGAFGIVLAASRIRATESQKKYASTFAGAVSASVLLFMIGGMVILGVLANYQLINKDETVIRPAYITNTRGARDIVYNPRIRMVLNRLHAGNIYDVNGLLLATSSPDSLTSAIPSMSRLGFDAGKLKKEAHRRKARYYTMGDHMLFMLGDAGTRKVLGYMDDDPIGFMAEERYAGKLRGLDIPTERVELRTNKFRENRFVPKSEKTQKLLRRDYTNIVPFLEFGLYNNPLIAEFNSRRNERDMYLTVDATLQKMLQDAMANHFPTSEFRNNRNLRASAVVLNAATGDLLASANYPLPEQDSIVMLNERGKFGDAMFETMPGHRPITERDLGMTFQTPPGSTAKVMTSMAALKKFGPEAADIVYTFSAQEGIEGAKEPLSPVDMRKAIVYSSNNYFINLLNDKNLYSQLGDIYEAVGARLHYDGKETRNVTSYFFNVDELNNSVPFRSVLSEISTNGLGWYARITAPDFRPKSTNRHWRNASMALAWGQGALRATPLMMARVASIVANEGKLAPTRYVNRIGNEKMPYPRQIEVIGPQEAGILKSFMQAESARHGNLNLQPGDSKSIGGKTGTPERQDRRRRNNNDAWYTCFMWSNKLNAPIAVALRIERAETITSGGALRTMSSTIIPTLNGAGYDLY